MKKEEFKELVKENFEEINEYEYNKNEDLASFLCYMCKDGWIYFKEIQKFPIIFEDDFYKIKVYESGAIEIIKGNYRFVFCHSLNVLEEALNKSKELRK